MTDHDAHQYRLMQARELMERHGFRVAGTYADLMNLAIEHGVAIPANATHDDLIAALEAAGVELRWTR
jgi:hypothetical protein